jgi:hypothetical protein
VAVELEDPAQPLSYVVVVLDEEDMSGDRDSSTVVALPGPDRRADGQA